MGRFRFLTALTVLLFAIHTVLAARVTNPKKVPKNAILLSKVASLTLRGDKKTAHRRVSAVPQLTCVGPPQVCKLYQIDVMRCLNEGASYDTENVQWSCKASLPEEFKLGSTDVSCEGYESSEDPYVLKGSCGVEYRLLLTEKGALKYDMNPTVNSSDDGEGSSAVMGVLVMIVFVVVIFVIFRGCLQSFHLRYDGRGGRGGPGGGGGGGGGWGGDDHDPPPPYDPGPTHSQTPRTSKKTTSTPRASSSRTTRTQENWRPGFWTGAATGAAAAAGANYLRGNRSQPPRPETTERSTGSGWFGGGNTRPTAPRLSSPGSSQNYSSSRYDSTGFGGTSRR